MPPKSISRLDFSKRTDDPRKLNYAEVPSGTLDYEEVDFSGNSLSAYDLPAVLNICRRCPRLRVLKLFKNCIDDYGAEGLADLCRAVPGLEEIHLSHNMFTAAGAQVIIEAAEHYRRPDTVPLWLRLEHNYIDDAEKVFTDMQHCFSVCRRTDPKLCTARTCYNRCRVHLPHFCLQRLGHVDSNQELKAPRQNHHLSRQVMRQFRAELEREKAKKPEGIRHEREPYMDRMGDRTMEEEDRRASCWTRGVSDQGEQDFAGFTISPGAQGGDPKMPEVHPEQLMDPGSCQEFVCLLCKGVIHDPTLTRCSHIFCSDCFQNWVTNRVRGHQTGPKAGSSMQDMPCPSCGQGLRKCDIVPLHHARHAAALVLQRCWSNVRIRCIHHPQHYQQPFGAYARQLSQDAGIECSWLGNLCDYVSHMSTCPVQNCTAGSEFAAIQQGAHSNSSTSMQEEYNSHNSPHSCFGKDEICIVLWDYVPDKPEKLALQAGDLVKVFQTKPNGWTGGILLGPDMEEVGTAGWFPTSYLDKYDERYVEKYDEYGNQYSDHAQQYEEMCEDGYQAGFQEEYQEGFGEAYAEMYTDGYDQQYEETYDKSYGQPAAEQEPFDETLEKQYSPPFEKPFGEAFQKSYSPQPYDKQYMQGFEKAAYAEFDNSYGGFDKAYVQPFAESFDRSYGQPFEKQYVEPFDKSYDESLKKQYSESFGTAYGESYVNCYDEQQYNQWYDENYAQYGYTM
mmetsp:Transcript_4465/g.10375  ORF Transcript_4465/g.10375 Transcript_4465/m.10375 type:complete len:730 (-) Transcript_4465:129-2318(-)